MRWLDNWKRKAYNERIGPCCSFVWKCIRIVNLGYSHMGRISRHIYHIYSYLLSPPVGNGTVCAAWQYGQIGRADTPRTINPFSPNFFWTLINSGMDILHGGHHVAQKSNSTTRPRCCASDVCRPDKSDSEKSGANEPAPTSFWHPKLKKKMEMKIVVQMVTLSL